MPHGLRVDMEQRASSYVVTLSGELDMGSAPQVARVLEPLVVDSAPTITVDLRGLSFIDASGLRALLRSNRAAVDAGRVLRLIPGRPEVARVFELAGVRDAFTWTEAADDRPDPDPTVAGGPR